MIETAQVIGARTFWQRQQQDSTIVMGDTIKALVQTTIDCLTEFAKIRAEEDREIEAKSGGN